MLSCTPAAPSSTIPSTGSVAGPWASSAVTPACACGHGSPASGRAAGSRRSPARSRGRRAAAAPNVAATGQRVTNALGADARHGITTDFRQLKLWSGVRRAVVANVQVPPRTRWGSSPWDTSAVRSPARVRHVAPPMLARRARWATSARPLTPSVANTADAWLWTVLMASPTGYRSPWWTSQPMSPSASRDLLGGRVWQSTANRA